MEGFFSSSVGGIDESFYILVFVLVSFEGEIFWESGSRDLAEFVLSLVERGYIDMIPFESFCLVYGDELYRVFFIADDVGCLDPDIIGLDERLELDHVTEGDVSLSRLVGADLVDVFFEVGEITSSSDIIIRTIF